jgi:hypothetical protein
VCNCTVQVAFDVRNARWDRLIHQRQEQVLKDIVNYRLILHLKANQRLNLVSVLIEDLRSPLDTLTSIMIGFPAAPVSFSPLSHPKQPKIQRFYVNIRQSGFAILIADQFEFNHGRAALQGQNKKISEITEKLFGRVTVGLPPGVKR